MPIEICNALGPDCSPDWNGISAIATAAATATALFIPLWQRYKDKKESRSGIANSLIFKMSKIHSDILKLWQYVQEQHELARAHNAPIDSWKFFRPLATFPTPIKFSDAELNLLFILGDNDTFNAVISMDEVHAADIAIFEKYAAKHETIIQLLPGSIMDGLVGSIELTPKQNLKLEPLSVRLDMLVRDMAGSIEKHSVESAAALNALVNTLNIKLGTTISLSLANETAGSPMAGKPTSAAP